MQPLTFHLYCLFHYVEPFFIYFRLYQNTKMDSKEKIYPLKGKVQHYSWGGHEFIPLLLGFENADRKPCAEYWMGAHPSASSEISINDKATPLYQLIQHDPSAYIGSDVFKRFGELPYLFKVLDVKDM